LNLFGEFLETIAVTMDSTASLAMAHGWPQLSLNGGWLAHWALNVNQWFA